MNVTIAENVEMEVQSVSMDFASWNWSITYKLRFPFGVEKAEHYTDRNGMNGVNCTPDQIITQTANRLRQKLAEQQKGGAS